MKKLLTLFALILAISAFAQTSDDRIYKIVPKTTEEFGILPGQSRLSPELYTSDIDSITFDVDAQTFTIYGGYSAILKALKKATYDLEKLLGFEFKYLSGGKMPSTNLDVLDQPDRNAFRLTWRPISGAAGYQIRYSDKTVDDWDYSPNISGEVTVGAEATDALIEHLQYSSTYRFAIRTLSPKGEGYHSEWSTRINFGLPDWNYLALTTHERYISPSVINVRDIRLDEATVVINTEFDPTLYSEADADTIRSRFELVDNHFPVDMLKIIDMQTGNVTDRPVTASDIASGQVKLTGLTESSSYTVTAYNTKVKWECDAPYNSIVLRTMTDSSTPILVTSTDLGTILTEYMENVSHMANQVFYLEGGKTYTVSTSLSLFKGVTIATNPADIAEGKRAKVELSTGTAPCNFMLGRTRQSGEEADTVNIDPIIFDGIDFSAPDAKNYGEGIAAGSSSGTGNYFINHYSNGTPYNLEALELKNCTFQKFRRGFVRMQGFGHKIAKINVDNNVFYNCGYYNLNSNDYAWFAGSGDLSSDIFTNFSFTNNTIYDSPKQTLVSNSNKNLAWDENTKWNIRIENNTFINFSTRSKGRYLINMRYMPAGSYISLQRNLFVLAADDADNRSLYFSGADIRTNDISFDVKDNYSVGCRDSHLRNDGIFTAGAFSATKNSFGGIGTNNGTAEDLIVKVGSTPLKATDLFTNPNPPYTAHNPSVPNELDHAAPDNIFEALRYRQTYKVLSHEIYTLGIGDPRWRNSANGSESQGPITVTSTDLSGVLNAYMDDSGKPQNQVYYLEGGKTYTISTSVYLTKGVAIATNPADLAEGKRAKVEFTSETSTYPCNFFLGKTLQSDEEPETVNIDPIIFNGIDFSAPGAKNYGAATATGSSSGTGNYFINNISNGTHFNLESLEIKNCTFQKFIRGFIRMQGSNHYIAKINVDNNLFYNCGYFAANGNGYGWFYNDGRDTTSDMFNSLNFTNNTIYDSPIGDFIRGSNFNITWPENIKWNIRIENNTFINPSTRGSQYLINARYMPAGSYISMQKNLFVLAADDADNRNLNFRGADIRTTDFSFDVKDNYSVGCRDSHLRNDGIFTAGAFSAAKNSFSNGSNNGTREDLIVKVGSTPLKATDLFTNPNPPYIAHDPATPNELDHAAPENIFEALRYRQTYKVFSHEIYTLDIGDPRWRNSKNGSESQCPITVTSTDLSSILNAYMEDSDKPQNQVYYLEGGKTYTISEMVYLTKGVAIATNPADLAEGKRAKVEFTSATSTYPCNFMLSCTPQPGVEYETVNIDPIVFDGIDFSAPDAQNFASGTANGNYGSSNYFINNPSNGIPYNLKSLEIKNCTFQKFIRGFIRMQGSNHYITKINIDNNLFYNCGYYNMNGSGYGWFHNDSRNITTDMFNNFSFTNNTIYDSPIGDLIRGSSYDITWPEEIKWNIRVENNTFINPSTRGSQYLISSRYMPAGSYISMQKNLLVLAADDTDNRNLNFRGADIRSTDFSFDVKDNYSVGCRDSHLRNDGIFTANAFSSNKNSFGGNGTNNGTAEDLIVKIGSTPLKATDLFTNPNPPYTAHDPSVPNELDHAAPENIFEALRYRQTPEVLSHEIYTLSIGDPRWRN